MSEEFFEVWVRKSTDIRAIRINSKNIQAVAKWCGGRIFGFQDYEGPVNLYIHVGVSAGSRIKMAKAWEGDWITWDEREEFRHFTDDEFRQEFMRKGQSRKDMFDVLIELLQNESEQNLSSCDRLTRATIEKIDRILEGDDLWAKK